MAKALHRWCIRPVFLKPIWDPPTRPLVVLFCRLFAQIGTRRPTHNVPHKCYLSVSSFKVSLHVIIRTYEDSTQSDVSWSYCKKVSNFYKFGVAVIKKNKMCKVCNQENITNKILFACSKRCTCQFPIHFVVCHHKLHVNQGSSCVRLLPERAPRSLNKTLERKPERSLWERCLGKGSSWVKRFISGYVSPSSSSMAASSVSPPGEVQQSETSLHEDVAAGPSY